MGSAAILIKVTYLLNVHVAVFQQHRHMDRSQRRCICELARGVDEDHISKRSLCRWTYEADYDAMRVPACIYRVNSCVNTVINKTENKCEIFSVRYPVRQNFGSSWRDSWMQLPVACTLASPRLRQVPYQSDDRLPVHLH